jgi:hypothetical protein
VIGPFDLALRLTAIALLLRPMGPWFVKPILLGLAVLALISPRALKSAALWLAMAMLIAVRIADDWPLADNHIYLLTYWCLAIGLALRLPAPQPALARASRWLLGLAFACAVLWKAVFSPDYLDGRFFRVTLQTDPRFTDASVLLGGLTAGDLARNQRALAALPEGAVLLTPPVVFEPPRLRRIELTATWGVLALEGLVAIAMLLPLARLDPARHVLLLAFCLVTYAFAPVAGFGWLLLVMGLAQSAGNRRALPALYVTAFLAVLFFSEVAWASLLGEP